MQFVPVAIKGNLLLVALGLDNRINIGDYTIQGYPKIALTKYRVGGYNDNEEEGSELACNNQHLITTNKPPCRSQV